MPLSNIEIFYMTTFLYHDTLMSEPQNNPYTGGSLTGNEKYINRMYLNTFTLCTVITPLYSHTR